MFFTNSHLPAKNWPKRGKVKIQKTALIVGEHVDALKSENEELKKVVANMQAQMMLLFKKFSTVSTAAVSQ